MFKPRIFISGAGGYANQYLMSLTHPRKGTIPFEFVGAADPFIEKSPFYAKMKEMGVKLYHDISEFFAEDTCDLCIISSPIHFHLEQTKLAMEHGAHVLCEKPIGATPEQAAEMAALEEKYGRKIMIGFQWSYAEGMLAFKQDIMNGVFGKPLDMRVVIDWPRGSQYYARPWAAKITDASGRPIFDSIANNACAHYIHNMLFMLGDTMDTSIAPESVDAQLYRANAIENFDTSFVNIHTAKCDCMFIATHAGRVNGNPEIIYNFENASVTLTGEYDDNLYLAAAFKDGTKKIYRMGASHQEKFYWALEYVVFGAEMPCTVRTATPHAAVIGAISRMPITTIDAKYITREELQPGNFYNVVEGMDDLVKTCYREMRMPTEADAGYVTATCSEKV